MAFTKAISPNSKLNHLHNLNLNGIFVPLPTTFKANEDICYDSLQSNLNKYEEIPITGYMVAGSFGEAAHLNPLERVSLVEFVRKNSKKIIIGNATAESTRAACILSKEIIQAGANAAIVMPSFYFKKAMTEEAIIKHYSTIADACAAPLLIYNNTNVTGLDISSSTLAKLAEHPYIRGVKDSDIRKCAVTVQNTRDKNFDVLISSAGYLLGGLLNGRSVIPCCILDPGNSRQGMADLHVDVSQPCGCSGGILGMAAVLGSQVCNLYTCFKNGKFDEAREIQQKLSKLDALITPAEMGVPALKTTMDLVGLKGGHCRRPLLPLSEADKLKLKQILEETEFVQ